MTASAERRNAPGLRKSLVRAAMAGPVEVPPSGFLRHDGIVQGEVETFHFGKNFSGSAFSPTSRIHLTFTSIAFELRMESFKYPCIWRKI